MNEDIFHRVKDDFISRAYEIRCGIVTVLGYLPDCTEVFIYPHDIQNFNPVTDADAFDGMTIFEIKVNTKHLQVKLKFLKRYYTRGEML